MNRTEIYQAIDAERHTQDSTWPNREQYVYNAPHVLVLEEKVSRLRSLWYGARKEELKAEYIKIAAIAVRALEEVR